MKGALDGLLVLSLEQAVAAPFCTARLADAGARVIKVERAEGDFARAYDHVVHGESSYFVWLNRGKESLVADLKNPQDAELVRRILSKADVFVQNLAPGAARRLGFDSSDLRAANPRLITCDISGYGDAGPCRDKKAYDLLIQCETGLADVTGTPEGPGRVGVSVADICCGMNAYSGILEALLARGVTGRGSGIAISLFDGLADWMAVPLLHHDYGGAAPQRTGIGHPSIAPYGLFASRDGRQIVIAIQNEREWRAFCATVLEQPPLAEDPRFASNALRCRHRADLHEAIDAVFARLDNDQLVARLEAAQVAYGHFNSVADFSAHPHLRRVEVSTPTGPVAIPAPPVICEDGRSDLGPVPAIGADSAAIRAEFQ